MRVGKNVQHMLVGTTASLLLGAHLAPAREIEGPLTVEAGDPAGSQTSPTDSVTGNGMADVLAKTRAAVGALGALVRPLSHPRALEDAFRGYFAFKATHLGEVQRPYLYFADYGLPSSTPRGYVFDMDRLRIVDGPFTVAHGRGSAESKDGIPRRFSNAFGSAATSLGLYLTHDLYRFRGQTVGGSYSAVGLRLEGVSTGYNDNAGARRVVAHGAPYVTPRGAGRSEGCPAMELSRARRLLPKLANGAMVFLFAPDSAWMENDPWIAGE